MSAARRCAQWSIVPAGIATFSAPKSVSLTGLVGGDDRVREAHRESVRTALDEMEKYVQARIGGIAPAQTTGAWAVAKFEHDCSRSPPTRHAMRSSRYPVKRFATVTSSWPLNMGNSQSAF